MFGLEGWKKPVKMSEIVTKNIHKFDDERATVREKKPIRFKTVAEVATGLSFNILHFYVFRITNEIEQ